MSGACGDKAASGNPARIELLLRIFRGEVSKNLACLSMGLFVCQAKPDTLVGAILNRWLLNRRFQSRNAVSFSSARLLRRGCGFLCSQS